MSNVQDRFRNLLTVFNNTVENISPQVQPSSSTSTGAGEVNDARVPDDGQNDVEDLISGLQHFSQRQFDASRAINSRTMSLHMILLPEPCSKLSRKMQNKYKDSHVFFKKKTIRVHPSTSLGQVKEITLHRFPQLRGVATFGFFKLDTSGNFHSIIPTGQTAQHLSKWSTAGSRGNRSKIWVMPSSVIDGVNRGMASTRAGNPQQPTAASSSSSAVVPLQPAALTNEHMVVSQASSSRTLQPAVVVTEDDTQPAVAAVENDHQYATDRTVSGPPPPTGTRRRVDHQRPAFETGRAVSGPPPPTGTSRIVGDHRPAVATGRAVNGPPPTGTSRIVGDHRPAVATGRAVSGPPPPTGTSRIVGDHRPAVATGRAVSGPPPPTGTNRRVGDYQPEVATGRAVSGPPTGTTRRVGDHQPEVATGRAVVQELPTAGTSGAAVERQTAQTSRVEVHTQPVGGTSMLAEAAFSDNEDTTLHEECETFYNNDLKLVSGVDSYVSDNKPPGESIAVILTRHGLKFDEGDKTYITIERDRALEQVVNLIMKDSFKSDTHIGVSFRGEDGVDAGALRASLFEIVKTRLGELPTFTEQPDGLHLQLNYDSLESRQYEAVGRLIGYLFAEGSILPNVLAPVTFALLGYSASDVTPRFCDVTDPSQRLLLFKIHHAQSQQQLLDVVADHELLLHTAGCSSCILNKEALERNITRFFVIDTKYRAIEQMKKGLQWAGILEDITGNPKRMADGLVYTPTSLDASCLLALMEIQYSADNEKKKKEEKVMCVFRMFLNDLEETGQLGKFLKFFTGKTTLPPLGFRIPLTIQFRHPEDVASSDPTRDLPKVMACFNVLKLPTGHKTSLALLQVLTNTIEICHDLFTDA